MENGPFYIPEASSFEGFWGQGKGAGTGGAGAAIAPPIFASLV